LDEELGYEDLQDKGFWCQHGLNKEFAFVELYGNKYGFELNNEKETNPYAPDLFQTYNNNYADLKTQNTPFFKAQSLYNIDPQFAVTFNKKDYVRYCEKYPNIAIYFAVDWIATKFSSNNKIITQVQPMKGIWWTDLSRIQNLVQDYPLHSYLQRKNDRKGNAKDSYIFNLNDSRFTKLE
jgi:hypothetical protein